MQSFNIVIQDINYKTDLYDITEILLKVALNTITLTHLINYETCCFRFCHGSMFVTFLSMPFYLKTPSSLSMFNNLQTRNIRKKRKWSFKRGVLFREGLFRKIIISPSLCDGQNINTVISKLKNQYKHLTQCVAETYLQMDN